MERVKGRAQRLASRRQRKRPAPVICAGRTRWGRHGSGSGWQSGNPERWSPPPPPNVPPPSRINWVTGRRLHALDRIRIAGFVNCRLAPFGKNLRLLLDSRAPAGPGAGRAIVVQLGAIRKRSLGVKCIAVQFECLRQYLRYLLGNFRGHQYKQHLRNRRRLNLLLSAKTARPPRRNAFPQRASANPFEL